MNRRNKRYVVRLEAEERGRLERLVSVGKGAAAKLRRARVLRQADQSPGGLGWTLRLLADLLVELNVVDSISYETVRRTLQKTS